MPFLILFLIALAVSSIGFHKFVWFISLGYGFSIAALGVALLVMYAGAASPVLVVMCALLVAYGMRLGSYLLGRELHSQSYNHVIKTQVNDGSDLSRPVQVLVWAACALLYACEVSPVLFRLESGAGADAVTVIGCALMACGIVLEAAADWQKSAQKRQDPHRFCDKGLYSFVRCPNYLGELLTWTGVFVSGVTALAGGWQWAAALFGYLGIVYVMFSGARRLEVRQNRNYGADPAYRRYAETTPILIPFVPLYSVEKYTWLKG